MSPIESNISEVEENLNGVRVMHAKKLYLSDSIYGLKKIEYICLKVVGHHHKIFSIKEDMTGFGSNPCRVLLST